MTGPEVTSGGETESAQRWRKIREATARILLRLALYAAILALWAAQVTGAAPGG